MFYLYLDIWVFAANCNKDPFHKDCWQDADLPSIIGIDSGAGAEEMLLTLSPELAMFIAYLLRFIVFHGVGLLLCWACTMRFRW